MTFTILKQMLNSKSMVLSVLSKFKFPRQYIFVFVENQLSILRVATVQKCHYPPVIVILFEKKMSKIDHSQTLEHEQEITSDIEPFISEKLNGCIFSAWYTERIWIEDLKSYRDQIKIDEDEIQMTKIFKNVNRKVKKLRSGFTGIERKID